MVKLRVSSNDVECPTEQLGQHIASLDEFETSIFSSTAVSLNIEEFLPSVHKLELNFLQCHQK